MACVFIAAQEEVLLFNFDEYEQKYGTRSFFNPKMNLVSGLKKNCTLT